MFIHEVKNDLLSKQNKSRCCKLAELSAFVSAARIYSFETASFRHEDFRLIEKIERLIFDLFNYRAEVVVSLRNSREYRLYIADKAVRGKIAQISRREKSPVPLSSSCCKRAFIRGIFIVYGTISNPENSYNLECIFKSDKLAEEFKILLEPYGIFGKIIKRKKYFVFYIKDSEQIADLLNVMEAHRTLLKFEELKVFKDLRNNLNRRVNCETANMNKAVSASVKQVEDIRYIENTVGLDYLSEPLRELAKARLAEPYANMKQLGDMLSGNLSKSGVNHRFKKISEIANKLREK